MTREQKRSLLLIAAAAVLLIGLHFVPVTGWLKLVLYLIPYLLVGGETLVDACKGIYNRQPFDENLLMAVATIGAMVLGDYPEAVSVMLFYQIGELFESYAVGRSRRNIGDLMDIRPDYANVETADGVARVKPEQVAVGDTIVVKPGERVPLDGTVLTGTSALNMSALTGESAPVDVAEGSTVVSGSVNLSGVLRLRVEKVYAESTVARILELVENSSLKKAHTERFITKFARVYTPSVCGAALALAILPPVVRLIMGIPAEWGDWIYRALTFLVISCPGALVISIPLSFFGGIGGASARGILIKGSSYLEMLAKTDRVVFDKTGTLTRGTFAVTAVLWLLDWNFLAFLSLVLFVFCVQFFRDPARELPTDPKAVLSPVDGRVCEVQKAQDPLTGEDAMMISIFMNVFNVHSQKSPVAGRVEEIVYKPGLFLNADLDKASTHNERNAVRVTTDEGRSVTFVQVAGLVARRILCYAKVGERLEKGERYGFIRFGSRVDVYLPLDAEITVSIGDKVTGVMSTIARL